MLTISKSNHGDTKRICFDELCDEFWEPLVKVIQKILYSFFTCGEAYFDVDPSTDSSMQQDYTLRGLSDIIISFLRHGIRGLSHGRYNQFSCMSYDQSTRTVFCGNNDGTITVLQENLITQLKINNSQLSCIVVNPTTHVVYSCGKIGYGRIEIWHEDDDKLHKSDFTCYTSLGLDFHGEVYDMIYSNNTLFVAKGYFIKLFKKKLGTTELINISMLGGHTEHVKCLAYDSINGILYSGSKDKTIKLWMKAPGMSDMTCVFTTKGHSGYVTCLVYDSTNHILYSGSGWPDKTIRIWKFTNSSQPLTCLASLSGHTWGVSCLVFCSIKNILISGSYDHTIKIWKQCKTNDVMTCDLTLHGHTSAIRGLAYIVSLSHSTLYSGSYRDPIKVWSWSS